MTEYDAIRVPRKRHRVWPWVVLALLVALVLSVIYAGDAIARPIAQEAVAQKMASALGVTPGDLKVSLASTPLPIQLLDGKVDTVDVDAPNITLGPLTGDATVHVEQVPIDTSKPIGRTTVTFTIDAQHLDQLAKAFGGGFVQSITLQAPNATAAGQVSVFGVAVPLGITLHPEAVGGKLAFTPTAFQVAGQTLTVDQLRSSPQLRGFADTLAQQQTVCIADHLPKAVTVTSVKVVGQSVVVTATGEGAVLSELGVKGACG